MPDEWTVSQTRRAIYAHRLAGPVLDIGTGPYSERFRPHFVEAGLTYRALDMAMAPGVDYVLTAGHDRPPGRRWGTVLLLSVLEHVPEPARIVAWARQCLRAGGHILMAVPCCWPQHDFPADYWRILPDGARWLLSAARGWVVDELVMDHGPDLAIPNQLFAVARKVGR